MKIKNQKYCSKSNTLEASCETELLEVPGVVFIASRLDCLSNRASSTFGLRTSAFLFLEKFRFVRLPKAERP